VKINVGQVTQVVSNLGVLAGIVFLAIEVRQNDFAVNTEAQISTMDTFNHFREVVATDDELSAIWFGGLTGESLEPTDSPRFDYLCLNYINIFAANHARSEAQGRPSEALARIFGGAAVNNPGLLSCWERVKFSLTRLGYESFVNQVDASLQQ